MFFFINLSSIICIARQHTLLLSSPRQLKTTLKVSQRKEALMLCMCIYIYTIPHIYSCQVRTVMERERERENKFLPRQRFVSAAARKERPPFGHHMSLSLPFSLCRQPFSYSLLSLSARDIYVEGRRERRDGGD